MKFSHFSCCIIIFNFLTITKITNCKDYYTEGLNRKLWASDFPSWLKYTMPPPAATSYFGVSTAITKNHMIIGAPETCGLVKTFPSCSFVGTGNGSAYIYNFDASNSRWLLQSSITAPPQALAFGWSVQIGNNFALITARRTGAFGPDNGLDHAYGSAYMYNYNSVNNDWELLQSLSEPKVFNYGLSTAMLSDASLFAISAPSLESNSGVVFIYRKTTSTRPHWTLQQALKSPLISGGTDFGLGINFDISNSNNIIVGSPNAQTVHIFNYNQTSSALNTWSVEITVGVSGRPIVGSKLDNFGTNVALNGDYMYVSAPGTNTLYIYMRKSHLSTTWLLMQTLSKQNNVTRYASSFLLVDNGQTLLIANSLKQENSATTTTSPNNAVGVYLYKSNITATAATTGYNHYQLSVFLPCAVSASQGQLPISMITTAASNSKSNTAITSVNSQILVGGSYNMPASYFNYTRTPDPSVTPTVQPSYPSVTPTYSPTYMPTVIPSFIPSIVPSYAPTFIPTYAPTPSPSLAPTVSPSTMVPTYKSSSISVSVSPTMNRTRDQHTHTNDTIITPPTLSNSKSESSMSFIIPLFVSLSVFIACVLICLVVYIWRQADKANKQKYIANNNDFINNNYHSPVKIVSSLLSQNNDKQAVNFGISSHDLHNNNKSNNNHSNGNGMDDGVVMLSVISTQHTSTFTNDETAGDNTNKSN